MSRKIRARQLLKMWSFISKKKTHCDGVLPTYYAGELPKSSTHDRSYIHFISQMIFHKIANKTTLSFFGLKFQRLLLEHSQINLDFLLDLRQATVIVLNLSRNKTYISQCSQRKAGRRKRARCASPFPFFFPIVPCASSPLTRVSCLSLYDKRSAWGGGRLWTLKGFETNRMFWLWGLSLSQVFTHFKLSSLKSQKAISAHKTVSQRNVSPFL